MSAPSRIHSPSRPQAGYAVLLVMFLAAVLLIGALAAVPNLLTEGRRQREDELIWRGQQYTRAIRLYFRKNGKFPQSVEDLVKPKNSMRFLRQAYKDPVNRKDGSWRFLYMGPGGQILGSVKQRTILQQAAGTSPIIGQRGAAVSAVATSPATQDQPQGANQPPGGAAPDSSAPGATSATSDDLTGKVFGGSIIGVGSKVDRKSIKTFDGSTNYREWEFLFDASQGAPGGAGQAPVAPPNPPNQQRPQRPRQPQPQL